jgi:hypothetical protein
MALVPENGTGLANADTFATRAELIAYALARGVVVPNADATDVHLVNAMDVLAAKDWLGTVISAAQGTPFPRLYIAPGGVDPVFPDDSVPSRVKKAQLALALASFQGVTLMAQTAAGPRVKSRDIGPMKRTYADGEGSPFAYVAGVAELLADYLVKGGFTLLTRRA